MKIFISSAILFSLLISHICFTAEYIPPTNSNAGTLRFDNIAVDSNAATSAILTAVDDANLQVGQLYVLDVNHLHAAVGPQDATFDSTARKFTSQSVVESPNVTHNLTMFFTGRDASSPNLFEFTVTNIQTQTHDTTGTLGGIDVESVYMETASARTSVTCRDTGDLMLTGGAICEPGSTLAESRPLFRVTDDGIRFAWIAACLQPSPAKPVPPKTIFVMCVPGIDSRL